MSLRKATVENTNDLIGRLDTYHVWIGELP